MLEMKDKLIRSFFNYDWQIFIHCRSTVDQLWSFTDQCRSSLNHCRSIADPERSDANYGWSIVDPDKHIVKEDKLYNNMLIIFDLSTDPCKLLIKTVLAVYWKQGTNWSDSFQIGKCKYQPIVDQSLISHNLSLIGLNQA
jgi:hypothetical protein